jgi:SOS response regulatory protein OraA/RecX
MSYSIEAVKGQLAGAILAFAMFRQPQSGRVVARLKEELIERGVSSEEIDGVFDAVSTLKDQGKRILRGN